MTKRSDSNASARKEECIDLLPLSHTHYSVSSRLHVLAMSLGVCLCASERAMCLSSFGLSKHMGIMSINRLRFQFSQIIVGRRGSSYEHTSTRKQVKRVHSQIWLWSCMQIGCCLNSRNSLVFNMSISIVASKQESTEAVRFSIIRSLNSLGNASQEILFCISIDSFALLMTNSTSIRENRMWFNANPMNRSRLRFIILLSSLHRHCT